MDRSMDRQTVSEADKVKECKTRPVIYVSVVYLTTMSVVQTI